MTKIIGLTGIIGSGKSTVAELLKKRGAAVIDTDQLGHEVYKPHTEAWREIMLVFGLDVIESGGKVNRQKLGHIVFNDAEALKSLERITHQRVLEKTKALIEEYRKRKAKVIVLVVPLLIEAGWQEMVDEVWVTTASESNILERLRKQRGLTVEEVADRVRFRLSQRELIQHAYTVINNDGSLGELKKIVGELWARITAKQA